MQTYTQMSMLAGSRLLDKATSSTRAEILRMLAAVGVSASRLDKCD